MQSAYVGEHPRHLASGRPLAFGDLVDAKDLTPEDEHLSEWLVAQEPPVPAAPARKTTTRSED